MARQVLGTSPQTSEPPDLHVAWHETWRAVRDPSRDAEAAARPERQRDICRMVYARLGRTVSCAPGSVRLTLKRSSDAGR